MLLNYSHMKAFSGHLSTRVRGHTADLLRLTLHLFSMDRELWQGSSDLSAPSLLYIFLTRVPRGCRSRHCCLVTAEWSLLHVDKPSLQMLLVKSQENRICRIRCVNNILWPVLSDLCCRLLLANVSYSLAETVLWLFYFILLVKYLEDFLSQKHITNLRHITCAASGLPGQSASASNGVWAVVGSFWQIEIRSLACYLWCFQFHSQPPYFQK